MRLFYDREIARSKYCKRRHDIRKQKAVAATSQKNKTVIISTSDETMGATGVVGPNGANAPGQSAKDEKVSEAQLKEKADKLRQLEEEKAEKEYQRLFDQFKSTLAQEDMRQETTTGRR